MSRNPGTCPNCGADVPRGARACLDCGADERTGWSEDAAVDRLELPGGGEFDHDEFVRREFGERGGEGGRGRWWVWLVALGLLAALFSWWVF